MKNDRRIRWNKVEPKNLNLKGLKVIVVGGTGGIGRAISRFMASLGAQVVVVGQTFRDIDTPEIRFIKADLSLMSEAKRVAPQLGAESANLVIFTTGIFAAPEREQTSEGIERDLAVSYLSRLVIIQQIAAHLGKKLPSAALKPRIFIMGYPGAGQTGNPDDLNAEKSYKPMAAHLNTVAGNEMLVHYFAKRYKDINFYGLNPSLLPTNIRSNYMGANSFKFRAAEWLIRLISISTETYAERLTPLLLSPDIENYSGSLFDQKGNAIHSSPGFTGSHIDKFMTASEELVTRALPKLN